MLQVDADLDAMFVSELNGTNRRTLIKGCIDTNRTYCFGQPRAVAVHPKRGLAFFSFCSKFSCKKNSRFGLFVSRSYVFWTDYAVNPYIARAGLDGTAATPIVTDRIGWPNALTIDYVTERLYWADAHVKLIE